jgi:hypothetical protein
MGMYSRVQGALTKPGDKAKGSASHAKSSRAASPAKKTKNRYQELKAEIHQWFNDRFKIAEALAEIQEKKLYRDEYETFDEFCMTEYGISRTYVGRLINALSTKASVASVPIGTEIKNESQARALSAVKEPARVAVLTRAAKAGPVTARAITEATKPRERKAPAPKVIDVEPEQKRETLALNEAPSAEPVRKQCPLCEGRGYVDG